MWIFLFACSDSKIAGPPEQPDPTDAEDIADSYQNPDRWLCRPDLEDACDGDLDVTAVSADGSLEVIPHVPAAAPAADCFYIYPTTSLDQAPQADFEPGPEEHFVVTIQAARYSAACQLFAPLYRQVTVNGLFTSQGDFDLAYSDVRAAFEHFLQRDSQGRPFLLLGHSQGSMHLSRLIAEVIEPDPALAERLIAAHLIGGFVEVPVGERVGATFASTPLCQSPDETGCVVHYNAFREDEPPGDDAIFGRSLVPGQEVACVNPAALQGGRAPLGTVLPLGAPPEVAALLGPQGGPFQDPETAPALSTPFYSLPGLVHGECVRSDGASFLAISVQSDPEDPRTDDIGGDLLPGWGLHLVDVSLTGLDLVQLAQQQIDAWTQAR